jgi:hypothetical protein
VIADLKQTIRSTTSIHERDASNLPNSSWRFSSCSNVVRPFTFLSESASASASRSTINRPSLSTRSYRLSDKPWAEDKSDWISPWVYSSNLGNSTEVIDNYKSAISSRDKRVETQVPLWKHWTLLIPNTQSPDLVSCVSFLKALLLMFGGRVGYLGR